MMRFEPLESRLVSFSSLAQAPNSHSLSHNAYHINVTIKISFHSIAVNKQCPGHHKFSIPYIVIVTIDVHHILTQLVPFKIKLLFAGCYNLYATLKQHYKNLQVIHDGYKSTRTYNKTTIHYTVPYLQQHRW